MTGAVLAFATTLVTTAGSVALAYIKLRSLMVSQHREMKALHGQEPPS